MPRVHSSDQERQDKDRTLSYLTSKFPLYLTRISHGERPRESMTVSSLPVVSKSLHGFGQVSDSCCMLKAIFTSEDKTGQEKQMVLSH